MKFYLRFFRVKTGKQTHDIKLQLVEFISITILFSHNIFYKRDKTVNLYRFINKITIR